MSQSIADPARVMAARIADRSGGWMDIRSGLQHFALINYAIPVERLQAHIPAERFEVVRFPIGGQECGLLSVVPFWDADFHFHRLAPFAKFSFAQTNHRVYVIDRQSGEHAVWFFGTTLGSWVVHCARTLWRIPWHRARYQIDCRFNSHSARYTHYQFRVESDWCQCDIELQDTGQAMSLVEGFASIEQQKLVLTHPVDGYFYRLDGKLGTYSVWHDEIPLTVATPVRLYCSLYERLGVMTRDEMAHPHSVFICPETLFEVHMPPRRLR